MHKELFLQLTGTGVSFNKKKHQKQINLFTHGETSKVGELVSSSFSQDFATNTSAASKLSGYIPASSLDFFNDKPTKTTATLSQQHEEIDDISASALKEHTIHSKPFVKMSDEEVRKVRTRHQIVAKGSAEAPSPILSFEELISRYGSRNYLIRNILEMMKWSTPTAVQMQAIPALMESHELLASAPTGSGKTAAYAIPMLSFLKEPSKKGLRGLVVAPTRVLADQIARDFNALAKGKDWRIIVSSSTKNLQKTKDKINSKRQDILIATPKWLTTMLNEGLDLSNVQRIVLDEADRLFELGFLEAIDQVITSCNHPHVVRSLFSATLPFGVEHMANSFLRSPLRVTIGLRNAGASTIKQRLLFASSEAGKLLAIRQQLRAGIQPPVLVFVQSMERARDLFNELMFEGIPMEYIHGNRSSKQTKEIVNQFRLGKIWVLICTDVMSRGLDFKGVSMVINYDFPQGMISYIHRIGRTGRAGREGEAITYFTYEDLSMLRHIADVMKRSGCEVPDWMLELKPMSEKQLENREKRPVGREAISSSVAHNPHDAIVSKLKKRKRVQQRLKDQKRKRHIEENQE